MYKWNEWRRKNENGLEEVVFVIYFTEMKERNKRVTYLLFVKCLP